MSTINPGSTSFFKTCFHGLNALSGVGILSIPYALSSGGWFSLSMFFLVATCTFYTGLLIQRCMDMDTNIKTYPDIGERAFGSKGRTLASVAMNTELYLVATGFLILEGDNLSNLFPNVEFEVIKGFLVISGRHGFIVIVGVLMLPTVWLDNMSILSYISASGVLSSFVLLGSVVWVASFDGTAFRANGTSSLNLKGLPTAMSLYAFCYCTHPVFPTLYTSMRNQKKFSKVLLVCFLTCTTSYASVAVLGYLMFGSNVESQITLNLPTNQTSSKVAIYTMLVNPLAKYALMVTPIVNALEHCLSWNNNRCKGVLLRMLMRMFLVFSTVVVALVVPYFEYLMSLVGAFFSLTASIILPCLCYLKISGIYKRPFGYENVVVWCIMVFGGVVLVLGTYTALQEIIEHMFK